MRPTVFTLQHAYCNMATTPPWDVYNKLRQDGTPNVEDIATYLNRRLTVRRDTFNICAIFVAVKPQLLKKEELLSRNAELWGTSTTQQNEWGVAARMTCNNSKILDYMYCHCCKSNAFMPLCQKLTQCVYFIVIAQPTDTFKQKKLTFCIPCLLP